jgi:hypothetical protein
VVRTEEDAVTMRRGEEEQVEKTVHKGGRNKCKDEVITKKNVLVVDKL